MDARTFDRLTAEAARRPTRRSLLRPLAAGLLGGLLSRHGATSTRAAQIDIAGPPSADLLCAAQGLTDCGGVCVDVTADLANCGACGRVCSGGNACSGGTCVPGAVSANDLDICAAQGLTTCSGVCIDALTDHNNCGVCGNSCPLGGYCQGGACVGGCVALGSQCVYGVNECCRGACLNGVCQCSPSGDVCSNNSTCCSDLCNVYGFCV